MAEKQKDRAKTESKISGCWFTHQVSTAACTLGLGPGLSHRQPGPKFLSCQLLLCRVCLARRWKCKQSRTLRSETEALGIWMFIFQAVPSPCPSELFVILHLGEWERERTGLGLPYMVSCVWCCRPPWSSCLLQASLVVCFLPALFSHVAAARCADIST